MRESPGESTHVLHVLAGHLLGGADRYAITLAAGLGRSLGYRASFAFLSEGSGADAARQAGFPTYVLGKRFRADLRCVARLAAVVKESEADVLHSHTFGANFYASLAAMMTRSLSSAPLVYTVHGFDLSHPRHAEALPWRTRLALLQDRVGLFRVQRIMVVSEHAREILLRCGYPPNKLTLIRNAVELPASLTDIRQKGLEIRASLGMQELPMVGTVGRMVAVKSHQTLVDAIDLLRQKGLRVAAVFVGDGPLRSDLEATTRRLGLSDHVRFLGIRSDAIEVMAGLDVFCLPSLYEGIPLSLLEAMSVGAPVVASEVSGIREIITHRQTGLLVPPHDSAALADAIQHLLQDVCDARQMAERASEMVRQRFSYDRMLTEVAQVYETCLRASR